eukprot:g733.t1
MSNYADPTRMSCCERDKYEEERKRIVTGKLRENDSVRKAVTTRLQTSSVEKLSSGNLDEDGLCTDDCKVLLAAASTVLSKVDGDEGESEELNVGGNSESDSDDFGFDDEEDEAAYQLQLAQVRALRETMETRLACPTTSASILCNRIGKSTSAFCVLFTRQYCKRTVPVLSALQRIVLKKTERCEKSMVAVSKPEDSIIMQFFVERCSINEHDSLSQSLRHAGLSSGNLEELGLGNGACRNCLPALVCFRNGSVVDYCIAGPDGKGLARLFGNLEESDSRLDSWLQSAQVIRSLKRHDHTVRTALKRLNLNGKEEDNDDWEDDKNGFSDHEHEHEHGEHEHGGEHGEHEHKFDCGKVGCSARHAYQHDHIDSTFFASENNCENFLSGV